MLYSQDMLIKLRFGELLKQRGITPNRLWQAGHGLSRNTVYGLANPSSDRVRIDLDVLAEAMNAVFLETGQSVSLDDVFEVIEEPVSTEGIEAGEWFDGAALAMSDRLTEIEKDVPPEELAQWHESFKKTGKPVKYDSKKRSFVGQA
jgi:hypothetical protein